MNTCEFCSTDYRPRPQVKKPRACERCQMQRQRSNEKDWRIRNPRYSSALYHRVQRCVRTRRLNAIAQLLLKCVQVGKDMMGMAVAMEVLTPALGEFLQQLGIRRANKFWRGEVVV